MLSRAKRRLEKELQQIRKEHREFEVVVPDDEILNWRVSFEGPASSIYAGERFVFKQPMESPEVVFVGKPPVHDHVYSNGFICLSTLYSGMLKQAGLPP